jgi:hypothetical protein
VERLHTRRRVNMWNLTKGHQYYNTTVFLSIIAPFYYLYYGPNDTVTEMHNQFDSSHSLFDFILSVVETPREFVCVLCVCVCVCVVPITSVRKIDYNYRPTITLPANLRMTIQKLETSWFIFFRFNTWLGYHQQSRLPQTSLFTLSTLLSEHEAVNPIWIYLSFLTTNSTWLFNNHR